MHQKHALTFRDYLLGLAAMEPCTQHGGTPAELRCRYIYRYYDQNGDSQLEMSEFRYTFFSHCLTNVPYMCVQSSLFVCFSGSVY